MLVHVVLMRFKAPLTETQTKEIAEGFARLAGLIPQIRSYAYGRDLALKTGNADYALVAEFASEQDLSIYRDHPEHLAFAKTVMGPLLETVQACQFSK